MTRDEASTLVSDLLTGRTPRSLIVEPRKAHGWTIVRDSADPRGLDSVAKRWDQTYDEVARRFAEHMTGCDDE